MKLVSHDERKSQHRYIRHIQNELRNTKRENEALVKKLKEESVCHADRCKLNEIRDLRRALEDCWSIIMRKRGCRCCMEVESRIKQALNSKEV